MLCNWENWAFFGPSPSAELALVNSTSECNSLTYSLLSPTEAEENQGWLVWKFEFSNAENHTSLLLLCQKLCTKVCNVVWGLKKKCNLVPHPADGALSSRLHCLCPGPALAVREPHLCISIMGRGSRHQRQWSSQCVSSPHIKSAQTCVHLCQHIISTQCNRLMICR